MSPNTVNVSTDSLDLLIRGTVWYNGVEIIGNNTPFTLYTTLEGITLKAGENVTLTSPGYIVTWADGYDSLTAYIKANGNVQAPNVTYRDVGVGYVIHIDEMSFENEIVEEKTLTVDKLNTYVPPDLPEETGLPQLSDVTNDPGAICILVIIAGAALMVVGAIIGNGWVAGIGIVAIVIAAAAWYILLNPPDLGLWSLANVPEYLQHWR
jgi:hypothetical protein